jgi:hypothetical protein
VKLDKNYSPVDEATAAGCRSASFHRLGTNPWSGTVAIEVDGERRDFEVEELATVWKVTGPTKKSVTGTSLTALLKKVSS